MLLKVKIEGRDTKNGAGVALVHDYTLHMLVYNFCESENHTGKAPPEGRIEVGQLPTALANAHSFKHGICPLEEQVAVDLVATLLNHAKAYECAVVWSKV